MEKEIICTCGVPEFLHGTSCGWNNASVIIKNGETAIVANMTGEERKERWLQSTKTDAVEINTIHCECPRCHEKFDVIPPENTVIQKSVGLVECEVSEDGKTVKILK